MNLFSAFANRNSKSSSQFGTIGFNSASWSGQSAQNFQKYAIEAYLKNVIAYRCIDEISRSIASVPWRVFRKTNNDKKELVEDHPVNELMKRPNPNQGGAMFHLYSSAFLILDGNTFIEPLKPDTGPNTEFPQELQVIRPDQIRPKTTQGTGGEISPTNQFLGWEQVVQGEIVKTWDFDPLTGKTDLLQLKLFHPINDIWGASPLEATARETDTSNEAIEWQKALLQNQGRPGLLVMYEDNLGDPQYDKLEKMLKERHTGAANAGKSLILEGGVKDVKPYNFTPTEMDFHEGAREKARGIAMGFGVPPQIIGIPGESKFKNYETAMLSFWENLILFYIRFYAAEYNNWFFAEDDIHFLEPILDDIPALAPRRKETWDKAQKSDFLKINEKRKMVGLDDVEGGDVILVQASMVELGSDQDMDEDEIDDDEKKTLKLVRDEGIDPDGFLDVK